MTNEKPNVILSARYSIDETCWLLKIHRDTLRTYTDRLKAIKCMKHRVGKRIFKYYSGSEILRFWENCCIHEDKE